MPRVEIVQKHNTAARRLYIRGHNGKIYPYLVMNDACLTESRREERVLQLLRLLNPCLEKRKETTKRHLFFTGKTRDKRDGGVDACGSEMYQDYVQKTRRFLHPTSDQKHDERYFCCALRTLGSDPLLSFSLSVSVTKTHTISIRFQELFPLLSSPCGLPPPRCLPTLNLCT